MVTRILMCALKPLIAVLARRHPGAERGVGRQVQQQADRVLELPLHHWDSQNDVQNEVRYRS